MEAFESRWNPPDAETEYRIGLIRAGMLAASFYSPDEEVFLFPFLDYLYLFFQPCPGKQATYHGPLVFMLWHNGRCRFSSLGDMYFTSKFRLTTDQLVPPLKAIRIAGGTDFECWLSIHGVATERLKNLELEQGGVMGAPVRLAEQEELLPIDGNAMHAAYYLLHGHAASSKTMTPSAEAVLNSDFHLLLGRSVCHERPQYPQAPKLDNLPSLNYVDDILPRLEVFRGVLDDVFADAKLSQSMQIPDWTPGLGNVFCVVRTVQSGRVRHDSFPYAAGLLLSTKQMATLQKWCREECDRRAGLRSGESCPIALHGKHDCLAALEIPLGARSRSVADAVFCSGMIDFAREPDDSLWDKAHPGDTRDQERVSVEKCIYPPNASLYYVPIHVSGMPWLAVFTFTPFANETEDHQRRWLHNYTFYRDIIQRAAALIRMRAREEYLRQASEAAASELLNWRQTPPEIRNTINASWETLARVYPFPLFRMQEAESRASPGTLHVESIPISGYEQWAIVVSENPFFGSPQVRWGYPKPALLAREFVHELQFQVSKRRNISFQETARSLAYSAHLLDTPLTELRGAVDKCHDATVKSDLIRRLGDIKSLTSFSMAVVSKRRREEVRQGFRSCECADFAVLLNSVVSSALTSLRDVNVAGYPEAAAAAAIVADTFRSVVLLSTFSGTACTVAYHLHQMSTAVKEILLNAVRYMDKSSPDLALVLGLDRNTVIFQVTNRAKVSYQTLDRLARNMTSGPADMLGVVTVGMACEACGYAVPEWRALYENEVPRLQAKVQIGTTQH